MFFAVTVSPTCEVDNGKNEDDDWVDELCGGDHVDGG